MISRRTCRPCFPTTERCAGTSTAPAFDLFRPDKCFALDNQPSQAVFSFFLPYTPEDYVWYNPAGCGGRDSATPISPGQTISAGGYWVINGIPTGPVGAQATYFFEPGGNF